MFVLKQKRTQGQVSAAKLHTQLHYSISQLGRGSSVVNFPLVEYKCRTKQETAGRRHRLTCGPPQGKT